MVKFKLGDQIKFNSICNFTGKNIELTGIVLGDEKAVRKMWPIEMKEASNCYFVQTKDNFGNTFHHAVFQNEIICIK